MNEYDPRAINRMAALLNNAASLTVVVFSITGGLTALVIVALGGGSSGTPNVLVWLAAAVYFALIAGVGYLIALVLRVIAQLMLAVVKIELNTSAGLDAQGMAKVEKQVSRVRLPDMSTAAMVCPKCGSEYRTGYDTCSDCHIALVSQV